MISILELEELLKIKKYTSDMKKAASALGIPPDGTAFLQQPFLRIDYLIKIIEREADVVITEALVNSLKEENDAR